MKKRQTQINLVHAAALARERLLTKQDTALWCMQLSLVHEAVKKI